MAGSSCYSITVRKFNVLSDHTEWFRKTQELYNEILLFYYNLYLKNLSENQPGTLETLRILEKMTVSGRDKMPVSDPLPWKKLPLYFRRAAINTAAAAARSYLAREDQQKPSEKFTESVTFYKGMYREFTGTKIELKLWDGENWKWCSVRLRGNTVPQTGQMMSPALVLNGKTAELHIPWKTPVEDGRNLKVRMAAGEKICSVIFTGQDTCMACCVMNRNGERTGSLFVRGGREYTHACRQIREKIEKSRMSEGAGNNPQANRRYWQKLKNIHDHYAHQFSRQVIDYCVKNEVKVLVLPEYDPEYSKIIMATAGMDSPLSLHKSIREKLKYKGWQQGIVTTEIQQQEISSVCSICGGKIRRKGAEFICENGHQGNRYLNMAHNLGQKCLNGFSQKH